jgi:hypothetical protein
VTALLDRSERIQGERSQIDELRSEWESRCAAGDGGDEGDGESPGKSHGKKKGQGGED